MNQNALIIFFKNPVPNHVKTRLIPTLSAEDAATLYKNFVLDIFEEYSSLRKTDIFAYAAPTNDPQSVTSLVPEGFKIMNQQGESFSLRMENAFAELFELGYKRVVIIGTDSPTLSSLQAERAFDLLGIKDPTVTIGPSEDGGYYLLGMNALQRGVFYNVRYSDTATYEDTLRQIVTLRTFYFPLATWYDIDDEAGFLRLVKDVKTAEADRLTNTRAFLENLRGKYKFAV
jgi:rSAM/selenodomain-associated transferase 1